MPFSNSLLLTILTCLLLTSCRSGNTEETGNTVTISWDTEIVEVSLNDDLSFLGEISSLRYLDDSQFLVFDGKPSISVFDDHEMIRTIGNQGEGPCEYSGINTWDVDGDTLFVLTSGQNKIIRFQINSGECLGETENEYFSNVRMLKRADNSFYLGNTFFSSGSEDSTRLIRKLFDNGTTMEVEIPLLELDPLHLPLQFVNPQLNFSMLNNRIYFYIPKTSSMASIDISDDSWNILPLHVDFQRDELESAEDNPDQIMQVLQNGYPLVQWIHAAPEWLTFFYVLNPNFDSREADYYLQFYSYDGGFLGELESDTRLYGYHNGSFYGIRENENPDALYAYEIVYLTPVFE